MMRARLQGPNRTEKGGFKSDLNINTRWKELEVKSSNMVLECKSPWWVGDLGRNGSLSSYGGLQHNTWKVGLVLLH